MKTVGNGKVLRRKNGALVRLQWWSVRPLPYSWVFLFSFQTNTAEPKKRRLRKTAYRCAPGNELPIAPITPPASPPITTPSDNPPVSQ